MKVELLHITDNAEKLIELAARTCYKSEVMEGDGKFIKNLIRMEHFSVLEHGYATFRISEVSRALTHQLVRHRIASYSQQSQRYVREDQFGYVTPPSIYDIPQVNTNTNKDICNYLNEYKEDMRTIQAIYNKWKGYGMKNEDARFFLPNACHTEIVMSANFREFRTVFKIRCDKHAQWEIRALAKEMLKQLYAKCPNVFRDLNEQFIVSEK